MPKLKVFSGQELIKVFVDLGFQIQAQKGSHIKLVRIAKEGHRQILTIPYHKELDRGTVKAIFNQARRYITEETLREHFYTN